MKVLLTIGDDHFLLPNDKGLQTVIATLSRSLPAYDRRYQTTNPHIRVTEDPPSIEVKYIPEKTQVRVSDSLYSDDDGSPITARIKTIKALPPKRAVLRLT